MPFTFEDAALRASQSRYGIAILSKQEASDLSDYLTSRDNHPCYGTWRFHAPAFVLDAKDAAGNWSLFDDALKVALLGAP